MADLDRLPRRAHEDRRRAELADRVHHDEELDAIGEHHRDAVAGFDATRHDVPSEGVGQPVELGEGPAGLPGKDRRAIRRLAPRRA